MYFGLLLPIITSRLLRFLLYHNGLTRAVIEPRSTNCACALRSVPLLFQKENFLLATCQDLGLVNILVT
jgi:hypothetical protein